MRGADVVARPGDLAGRGSSLQVLRLEKEPNVSPFYWDFTPAELVGRAGVEPATNGLKDRVPIEPKYLTTMLLRRLDCGKQLPTTGRKSTALLRALLYFPHIRHCPREAASERENLMSRYFYSNAPLSSVRATGRLLKSKG
jgi:hypothetical protein